VPLLQAASAPWAVYPAVPQLREQVPPLGTLEHVEYTGAPEPEGTGAVGQASSMVSQFWP